MTVQNWIDDPESWNRVRLGSFDLPGIAQVTMSRGREIDFKKAPGKDGGTSTDKGANEGKIKIRLTMNARQWSEKWLPILPHLEPAQGKPSGPHGIAHPEPNSRGINVVEISDIASAPPTARGGYVLDIECQQWFPRPKDTKASSPRFASLPSLSLFTTSGTDRNVDATRLLPSGGDVLDQVFGGQQRTGVTVVENPVTGEIRGVSDEFSEEE